MPLSDRWAVAARIVTFRHDFLENVTMRGLTLNILTLNIDDTFFQGIRPVRCVTHVPGQLVTHVLGSYHPGHLRGLTLNIIGTASGALQSSRSCSFSFGPLTIRPIHDT